MPRKSVDHASDKATMSADKPARKNERSHEENQERAYIAASRRADRSIEARVQSARMASEIHKKRTGKSFRISEEIVMKEEMYEEEEDNLPRSYRLLGPHMQTASDEMNARVEAYLSNRMAMSALLARTNDEWRNSEIHRLFAQSFPNANEQAAQLSQSMSKPKAETQNESPSPSAAIFMPGFSFNNPPPGGHGRRKSNSSASGAAIARRESVQSSRNHDSGVSPASNPASASTYVPASSHTTHVPDPDSHHTRTTPSYDSGVSADPSLDWNSGSAFTAELPPEAKMLMQGINLNQGGQNICNPEWMDTSNLYTDSDMLGSGKMDDGAIESTPAYFPDNWSQSTPMDFQPMSDENWDAFINESPWNNEPDVHRS